MMHHYLDYSAVYATPHTGFDHRAHCTNYSVCDNTTFILDLDKKHLERGLDFALVNIWKC